MKPYYQDQWATIYHGDCREILPKLRKVDLVLTDSPYGIGDGDTNKNSYVSYDDTPKNLDNLIEGFMPWCLENATRIALTPGVINMWRYPAPTWVLCWIGEAGTGSGPWGFCCWQPILVYGKDPYLQTRRGRQHDFIRSLERAEKNGHPCPKPIGLWKKILMRVQPDDGVVYDPFMGSGTTLRIAKDIKRKCIGIELEEKYCEIAAKRLVRGDNLENIKVGKQKSKGVQTGFGL